MIRFGALPSVKVSPEKLIVASLREAEVGLACPTTFVRLGPPRRSRRQAEQFNGVIALSSGGPSSEIDVMAELLPTRGRR